MSHLLYPQVLDDTIPEQREQGIAAGLAYLEVCEVQYFYIDRGFSRGMLAAIQAGKDAGCTQVIRYFSDFQELPKTTKARAWNTYMKLEPCHD